MKSFAKVAFVGLSGVVLFKLFTTILLPLLGLFLGLLALTVKVALVAAVVYFVYSLLKKRNGVEVHDVNEDDMGDDADVVEGEAEVES